MFCYGEYNLILGLVIFVIIIFLLDRIQMVGFRKKYGCVSYLTTSSQKLRSNRIKNIQNKQNPTLLSQRTFNDDLIQLLNQKKLASQTALKQQQTFTNQNYTSIRKKEDIYVQQIFPKTPLNFVQLTANKITNIKQLCQLKRQKKQRNKKIGNIQNKNDNFLGRVKIVQLYRQGSFGKVYRAILFTNGCKSEIVVKKVAANLRYINRQQEFAKMLKSPYVVQFIGTYYTQNFDQHLCRQSPINELTSSQNLLSKPHYSPTLQPGVKKYQVRCLNIIMAKYNNNLSQIIQMQPLQPYRIKIYLYQMIRAIMYIHSLNICHRDIKPHNFLIKNNRIFLCDFGAAKKIHSKSPFNKNQQKNAFYVFSREYRSPQLMFGKDNYDKSVDIWAMGCVAAQMILRKPLFNGTNNLDQLIKILKVLGSPRWHTISFCKDSHIPKIPQISGIGLAEVIGDKCDKLMCDLISKMLKIQPNQRILPIQALSHPYFDQIREESFYRIHLKSSNLPNFFHFTKRQCFGKDEYMHKLIPFWIKQYCKSFQVSIKDYNF